MEDAGFYLQYQPPGPVANGWLNSVSEQAFIVGPVGSAKTTTGVMKCLQVTKLQHPSTKDGIRKAVIVAVRMNYRRMHDTLIPSVRTMFPKTEYPKGTKFKYNGVWSTNSEGLMQFDFRWDDYDAGACHMTILFRAFGDQDVESFIRGFQPTAWWLNEADEIPEGSLGLMAQRVGRAYMNEKPDPSVVAPPAYSGIFGDLNAPDEDSWFYRDVYENPKPNVEVFIQPSGFSPNAENLKALRRQNPDYYNWLARSMEEWQIRRFIRNEIGMSRHGTPVYPEYDIDCEVDDLQPEPKRRIVIGVDQGNRPAAIFTQVDSDARLLVFDEAVPPPDVITNGRVFGAEVAEMMLLRYRPWCVQGGYVFSFDPASKARDNEEKRWYQQFMLGVMEKLRTCPIYFPYTNKIDPRVASVKTYLRGRALRGGGPRLVVCRKKCPEIRRGFASGYRLLKQQNTTGKVVYKIDKNQWSDPHDGLQYAAMAHAAPSLEASEQYGGAAQHPYSPPPDRSYEEQGEVVHHV